MRPQQGHGDIAAVEKRLAIPGHAPARATYDAMGFTRLPIIRYFQLLTGSPVGNGGVSGAIGESGGDCLRTRNSRFLPPAASKAVATASPMSPARILTSGLAQAAYG